MTSSKMLEAKRKIIQDGDLGSDWHSIKDSSGFERPDDCDHAGGFNKALCDYFQAKDRHDDLQAHRPEQLAEAWKAQARLFVEHQDQAEDARNELNQAVTSAYKAAQSYSRGHDVLQTLIPF